MIKFSQTVNKSTYRRRMANFNNLMKILKDKESTFFPEIIKQLNEDEVLGASWPHGYMNDLYVEYEHSVDYISIQGKTCGIRITPELISINVQGMSFMGISTDASKDEYFNQSVSEDMYNLNFNNILYLQDLKEKINNYKNYGK